MNFPNGKSTHAAGIFELLGTRTFRTDARYSPVACWITFPFVALLLVDLWHHEMWSDELHAWGMVIANPDLRVFFHELHYEGHPGLWHLLLWGASFFTADPVAMKFVQGAIAIVICLMIGFASPFRPVEKFLLLLNYFVVFEYTVVSRNYGIGLLLALCYAYVRATTPDRSTLIALILGALANTNVYAGFLSGVLMAEYFWSTFLARRPLKAAALGSGLTSGAVYFVLLAFAVVSVYPPPDISHHTNPLDAAHILDIGHFGAALLRFLVTPFLPIDFSFPATFAFPGNYFSPFRTAVATLMLVPIGAALWLIFRRDPKWLAVIFAAALCSAAFSHIVYVAAVRHFGVTFVAFLTCLWLVRPRLPVRSLPVLFLLGLGAFGGAASLAGQWTRPFSPAGSAARWLQEHNLRDAGLIGVNDIVAAGVGIALERPVYFLDCECSGRYAHQDNRRDRFVHAEIPDRLARAALAVKERPLILIAGLRLSPDELAGTAARGSPLRLLFVPPQAERDPDIVLYAVDTK